MSYEGVKNWRTQTKSMLVESLGGKCCNCGYDKCNGALDFHHIDPSIKEYNISDMLRRLMKTALIVTEAKKCVLLCRNCHAEYHAGLDISLESTYCDDGISFSEANMPWWICKTKRNCDFCNCEFTPKSKTQKFCSSACGANNRHGAKMPDRETLEKLLWEKPMRDISKIYGVSDKTISNWSDKLGCSRPEKGYWIKNN